MLSFVNIINTSALSYQSSVGVGFTFNPTLSIDISSDLIINNLIPGSTLDSNSINVSVATNAAYGYTLSANIGNDIHNNSNLTHTNNTDIFSSIAIDADLASLEDSEDNNIWGYSYKNNTLVSPAWSNYNGLSNSSNAILLDNSNAADSTGGIDFKIAAKASNTQPSGEYTNTINFIAVSKVAPMSLLDSFIASGAEQYNGYFKMQDMTHGICNNVDIGESELQLIDVRDNKIYWVAKLKDGNCWMTQNLDLDIVAGSTNLTSDNTDLSTDESIYTANNTIYALKGAGDIYGYTYESGLATWIPERSTIDPDGLSTTWQNNNGAPYSYNPGPIYYYTSNSTANDIKYSSLQNCLKDHPNDCPHYSAGNYYNWTSAIAANNMGTILFTSGNADNSICPKGWGLPSTLGISFENLINSYEITSSNVLNLRSLPIYLTRSGDVGSSSVNNPGINGSYWTKTAFDGSRSNYFHFQKNSLDTSGSLRYRGNSIRCIAK